MLFIKLKTFMMTNYNDRRIRKENKRQNTLSLGHMTEFDIAKESNLLEKTLEKN
jgi:CPA2 family monovalent cation:H+ antiporter-2